MKVKFTTHTQTDRLEFGAKDFEKAGVDHKKTVFPVNESVEVPDEVGQALISDDGIFAGFKFEEVTDDEDVETDDDSTEKNMDGTDEADLGKADGANSTSEGDGSTGAGTSTSGGRGSRSTRGSRT